MKDGNMTVQETQGWLAHVGRSISGNFTPLMPEQFVAIVRSFVSN
jgi:hypothetical protein